MFVWLLTSPNGCRCDSVDGLIAVRVFMEIFLGVDANAVTDVFIVEAPLPE
jgi:hypothetical protein